MDRMAQHSKQPEVLRELFAALGNDPFVIAECLARPVLAERFAKSDPGAAEPALTASRTGVPPAHSTRLPPQKPVLAEWLAKAETRVPMKMAATRSVTYTLPVIASPSGTCIDDSWTATSTTNAPTARYGHTAVWTGSEMIVWGGYDGSTYFNTGGRYNPSTDSWTATSTINAPAARFNHTAVWTGSEMIVWGGFFFDGTLHYLNTGGRYNPGMGSWTATSTTNAPTARDGHTAVWTGSEMIVWGGLYPFFNTGGRYNPGTDSWTATSISSAPSARFGHTAVWNGSEQIVWWWYDCSNYVNTGGRYNSSMDSWMATTTTNAPFGRLFFTAVWTGSEMIVWGGGTAGALNTGGRYCAQAGSPTPMPTPGPLQLRAQQRRVGGINTVRLNWRGATSPNVNIYRNDVLIATQPNDPGVYIDSTGDTGRAQYTYYVCEAGTQTCSNEVLVRFPQ